MQFFLIASRYKADRQSWTSRHSCEGNQADVAFATINCEQAAMHSFPSSTELQFLIGKELAQVALDPHSVQFRWFEGGQITVQYDFEHVDEDGQTYHYDCRAHIGPPLLLHRLIQKKVLALEAEPFCLTLKFEAAQILRFRSEIGQWECGLIQFTKNLEDGYIIY